MDITKYYRSTEDDFPSGEEEPPWNVKGVMVSRDHRTLFGCALDSAHPKGKNLLYHHKTIQKQPQTRSEFISDIWRANELKIYLTNITEWTAENSALIVSSTDSFNFLILKRFLFGIR